MPARRESDVTGPAVVITKFGQERLGKEWGAAVVRRALVERLTRSHDVRHFDASDGSRALLSQVLDVVDRDGCTTVFICDLYALSTRGALAPLEAFRWKHQLNRRGVRVNTLLWDLLDPAMAYASNVLVGSSGRAFVIANTSEEASLMGIRQAIGPSHQWLLDGILKSIAHSPMAHESRPFDVYLPPRNHTSRSQLLRAVAEAATSRGLKCPGSESLGYRDYLNLLSLSRSAVVVNEIRASYRATLPRGKVEAAPRTHAVGRNFEVVAAGSTLIAQHTDALREYFEPGRHFLEWKDPREAADMLLWAVDNPETAATMAREAHEKLVSIHKEGESNTPFIRGDR